MNKSKLLDKLNKKYIFLIEIERQIGDYIKVKCNYLDVLDFYVSYRYTSAISEEQNFYFLCNKIDKEIVDTFKRKEIRKWQDNKTL